MGTELSVEELSDCTPTITNKQMDKLLSFNGTKLNPDAAAFPCGLVAKSFFNDTFSVYNLNNTMIPIDSKNIAWESDVEHKFKNIPKTNWDSIQWMDVTNRKS